MRVGDVMWWRSRDSRFVAALLAAASLLALSVAPAADAARARGVAAKVKTVACKKGTVLVVVQRKRRCRALNRVFPKPLAGDVRLAFLKGALATDLPGLRDRKGRRLPSTRSMLARIGPRAYAGLLRELPHALTHLDQLASQPAAAARRTGDTRAHRSEVSFSDTYTLKLSGVELEFGFSGGTTLGMKVAVKVPQKDGQKVVVTMRFGFSQGAGFSFRQRCPMADGTLDGKYDLDLSTETALYDASGKMVSYGEDAISEHALLHGQTADDAMLDFVDVSDTLELQESTGGSIFGTVRLNAEFQHKTRIDMRTGQYVADQSTASSVTHLTGVLRVLQGLVKNGPPERVQANADKAFAGTVKATIDTYRELEGRWNVPNTCADVRFSPSSDSLSLSTGEAGEVTATVERKDEPYDHAKTSAWTLSGPQNATFTPTTANANPQDFSYTTTKAGPGVKVAATFRSVSKLGVGEVTWTQPTTAWPQHVKVTLSSVSEFDPFDPGTKWTWSGSAVADLQSAAPTQDSKGSVAQYLTEVFSVGNWLEVVGPSATDACVGTSVEFSGTVSRFAPGDGGAVAGVRVRLTADGKGASSYSMWGSFVAGAMIDETVTCPDPPPYLSATRPQGVAGSGAFNLSTDPMPDDRPYGGTLPIAGTAHFNTAIGATVDVTYTIDALP